MRLSVLPSNSFLSAISRSFRFGSSLPSEDHRLTSHTQMPDTIYVSQVEKNIPPAGLSAAHDRLWRFETVKRIRGCWAKVNLEIERGVFEDIKWTKKYPVNYLWERVRGTQWGLIQELGFPEGEDPYRPDSSKGDGGDDSTFAMVAGRKKRKASKVEDGGFRTVGGPFFVKMARTDSGYRSRSPEVHHRQRKCRDYHLGSKNERRDHGKEEEESGSDTTAIAGPRGKGKVREVEKEDDDREVEEEEEEEGEDEEQEEEVEMSDSEEEDAYEPQSEEEDDEDEEPNGRIESDLKAHNKKGRREYCEGNIGQLVCAIPVSVTMLLSS